MAYCWRKRRNPCPTPNPKKCALFQLQVCIGGYHKFNSSSIIVTEDGLRREGIFGLISPNQTKDNSLSANKSAVPDLTDDVIKDDVEFLVEKVLYVWQNKKLVRNNIVYGFYEDLCDRFSAGIEIFCRITDYVVGNVPILIPQDDQLLYGKCYQPPGGQGKRRFTKFISCSLSQ